jgi:putative Mg2+ transporter-C (MgtC) family protein
MTHISNLEELLRIAAAIMCGALIGWERESREKSAGFRTHVFVAMGSALVMLVSSFGFAGSLDRGLVVLDPSRVAAQVVSGIGFLGAGVIWFARNKLRGLDTAAGIWTTSAVGLSAGCGMYIPAFIVTIAVVTMNLAFKPIGHILFPRSTDGRLLIGLEESVSLEEIRSMANSEGIKVKSVRLGSNGDGTGSVTVSLDVVGPKAFDWLALAARMKSLVGVQSVSFNEHAVDNN